MKPHWISLLLRGGGLLKLFVFSPVVTLRLITWRRAKNACRVLLLRQGNLELLLQRYRSIYNENPSEIDESIRDANAYRGDIIFFPVIDWCFRFQRPQHLAREFGALGYRVFYASTVPLISSGERRYAIQGNPVPGVVLVQLSSGSFRTPDLYQDDLEPNELDGFREAYLALCADFAIEAPTILVQQPFWWPLVRCLARSKLVYDCIDHHAGFHDQPNPMLLAHEEQLVIGADVVVATSDRLADSFLDYRACQVIRNACEYERFSQAIRVKSAQRPIVGYVGAVSEWFDGDLIYEIAKARPNWQFDIYGAIVGANISCARMLPNVNFFGEISYESVPNAIAHFDVCIIPFKINELTRATNPVKIYEYMAVGRPVVAPPLPELATLNCSGLVCASSATEFVNGIERLLECSDAIDAIEARKNWAAQNTWNHRGAEFLKMLDQE